MGTVVLGTVGNIIAPGIGGFIGAALGSYIDSEFLFPPPDLEGPKLDGLKEQRGSEGMPFNFTFGERVRVPAKIIWIGPESLIFDGASFFNHVAIDVSQGEIDVNFLDKIYANGQVVFEANPQITIVTSNFTMHYFIHDTFPGGDVLGIMVIRIVSPLSGPDLTEFVPGVQLVMSGWLTPNTGFNTTYTVYDVGLDPSSNGATFIIMSSVGSVSAPENIPFDEGNINSPPTVTFAQLPPTFQSTTMTAVSTYCGTVTQTADPLMVTVEGVGLVPARRGRAYIVLSNFNITKFGNRMPNFEVVLRPNPGMSLAQAIDKVLTRVPNITTGDWDTSAVLGDFDGASLEEPIDSLAVLQVIMMAYRVGAREVDGKLLFFNLESGTQLSVDQKDLASYEEGGGPEVRLLGETDVLDSTLPFRVEVEFANIDDKLEPGLARDTSTHVLDGSKHVNRIRLPLSMTRSRAACLAKILMLNAFAERQARKTSLPPLYKHVSEGDELLIDIDGDKTTMLVQQLDYGKNGLVDITGSRVQPHIAGITAADCPVENLPSLGEAQVDVPPPTLLFLSDIAPLDDAQAETAGIIVGMVLATQGVAYVPVTIYRQLVPAGRYLAVQFLPAQIAAGFFVPANLNVTVSAAYWDHNSIVNVNMLGGVQLVSATEAEVLAGANMAFFGREVIAYQTVSLQGDGTYNITGLLRGLRGTEGAILTHASGGQEMFVPHESLVVPGTISPVPQPVPISSHGTSINLKPVQIGDDEANVTAQALTLNFSSLMPFPVYSVRENRNSASDLTLTWDRQTRRIHPLFAPVVDPLLEPAESYEIDVLNGTTVVATKITTTRVLSYTSAQQVVDGLPGTGTIHFKIYQMSASIGRGKEKDITI